MSPSDVASIYASTAIVVGIILALAGLGSALGWGLICGKYIDGIARQPELRPQLLGPDAVQRRFDGSVSVHRAWYRDVVRFRQPVRSRCCCLHRRIS